MTIVDNNVLSALAKIERLGLLREVFDAVATPNTVIDELRRARAVGYEFVTRIEMITSYRDGWLEVVSPTEAERQMTDEIHDHARSITDSWAIAIAATRDRRLLTDDAHVGTIGRQHGVDVWDLPLFLRASIRLGVITSSNELSVLVNDLAERDNYRFTQTDEESLFEEFER